MEIHQRNSWFSRVVLKQIVDVPLPGYRLPKVTNQISLSAAKLPQKPWQVSPQGPVTIAMAAETRIAEKSAPPCQHLHFEWIAWSVDWTQWSAAILKHKRSQRMQSLHIHSLEASAQQSSGNRWWQALSQSSRLISGHPLVTRMNYNLIRAFH